MIEKNNLVTIWLPMIIGALATLVGAFLGSYLSVQLNNYKEIIASDDNNSRKINELLFALENLFNVLTTTFTEDYNGFYFAVINSELNFPIKIDDFLFLSQYSDKILPLLSLIKFKINAIYFYIKHVKHEQQTTPQQVILSLLYHINIVGKMLLDIYSDNKAVNTNLLNINKNEEKFREWQKKNSEMKIFAIRDLTINEKWIKPENVTIWTILRDLIKFLVPCTNNKKLGK